MHHDPDATTSCILDVQFSGTDERYITEPGLPSRCCRKGRMNVISRSEQDADDVIVVNTVAIDHLREQRNSARLHLLN